MEKKRKPKRRLATSHKEIKGRNGTVTGSTGERVDTSLRYIKHYWNDLLTEIIPAKQDHRHKGFWDVLFKPLLEAYLSPAERQAFAAKHNPEGIHPDEMSVEGHGKIIQAALTRLLPIITVPENQHDDSEGQKDGPSKPQDDEAGANEEDAADGSGEAVPSSSPAGEPNVPAERPSSAGMGAAESSSGQGHQLHQPTASGSEPSEEKKPLKWEDLSSEEQERLRTAILEGTIPEGPPDEDATPIDVASFPDDLKEAFAAQVGQALQTAIHAFAHKVKRWLKARKSAEEASGINDDNPDAPHVGIDTLHEEFMDAMDRGEFDLTGDDFNFDDFDMDYEKQDSEGNEVTGYYHAKDKFRETQGYGGGGELNDLKIEPSTYEDRIFSLVQEQFMRLAGDPDPSAKRPEGDEVHNVRKLVKASWNPGLYPTAYQDLERAPEDIYLILDTSGSVNPFAETIAGMAAGALGLVHLYHGSEAHPQNKILRETPLKSYREFRGLGAASSSQHSVRLSENCERQIQICGPDVPGYRDWRGISENNFFEGNLEWWLMREKPPQGSRIIFWGDTESVRFVHPHRIARLLRPYKVTWLLPETLQNMEEYLRRNYGVDYETRMATDPVDCNEFEYVKLQQVGIPCIGGCSTVDGLRAALKKIR